MSFKNNRFYNFKVKILNFKTRLKVECKNVRKISFLKLVSV